MGTTEFVPDDVGVTVLADGHPQSHVCVSDPGLLVFEYVAQLAIVVDSLPPGRLAVTHVGGGGLTVPRYVDHTRPGSPQIVFEPDAALTAAVRARLPLPRGHRIRVRATDGLTGIRALADASADAIVLDAYAAGRLPAELVSPAFVHQVRRVLRPGGVLAANVADAPGLRHAARFLATLRAAGFADLALLATHDILKGRRFGNTVVAAASPRVGEPGDEGADTGHPRAGDLDVGFLERACARASPPCGIRHGDALDRLVAGARPFTDADADPSPPPPPLGSWRVR